MDSLSPSPHPPLSLSPPLFTRPSFVSSSTSQAELQAEMEHCEELSGSFAKWSAS